jgi:phosphoglycerol transferase MdoB-like AlkP superfamily enzyme
MKSPQEQLDAIQDMRKLMERSSRFLSLSGLSGVAIGVFALMGTTVLYLKLDLHPLENGFQAILDTTNPTFSNELFQFIIIDALIVLIASLSAGTIMSINRSKKLNLPSWDGSAKRLVINLMIPLISGGLLCLIFIQKSQLGMLAPLTLIFYGLALVNASKYTVDEIRNLGVLQIILGLFAASQPDFGLLCWSIGFGVLHIGYGLFIHSKHQS